MSRKLGKTGWILTALVAPLVVYLLVASVVTSVQEETDDRNADAYAARLRADGDRLAKEAAWEDALARYDQAKRFDRGHEDTAKRSVIEEHVGEVVWDKELERHGSPQ
jgi:hypothetical protein